MATLNVNNAEDIFIQNNFFIKSTKKISVFLYLKLSFEYILLKSKNKKCKYLQYKFS